MLDLANPIVWIVTLILFAVAIVLLRAWFGPVVREKRRRRRNHGRVVSKAVRPMVSLAVKTKSERGQ